MTTPSLAMSWLRVLIRDFFSSNTEPNRDNLDRDPEVGHQWPEGDRGEATALDIVGQDDAEIPVTVVIVVTASPAAEENDGLGARC